MPLLRRQPFHRQKPPLDLRPDEEVFLCKLTNEIFRDYEVTGRSGLTYQEAVECEEKALKHLATFPDYLQRPILFLATLTHRSRLVDMNDDVFVFAKDRYFVGEMVDVAGGDSRKSCKILKVFPAIGHENMNGTGADGDNSEDEEAQKRKLNALTPELYQYLVLEKGKAIAIRVKAKQISRKRGLYTRDKSKLFLKQHCASQMGLWKVKDDIVKKMKLNTAKFEDFFSGPQPAFSISKVKRKSGFRKSDGCLVHSSESSTSLQDSQKKQNDSEERRRHSLENEATDMLLDAEEANRSRLTLEEREAIKEQMKQERLVAKQVRKEEIRKKMEEERNRKREEKAREREKKMEEQRIQMEYLREWSRIRDDLQCDDLKVMPEPVPVNTNLPSEYFGDAIMILEFLQSFNSLFEVEEYFPDGLTFAMLDKALASNDINGPLPELLQLLLVAIFSLQEEEEEDDKEPKFTKSGQISTRDMELTGNDSLNQLLCAAIQTLYLPYLSHGVPLKNLTIDSFTLTEVLRLHIMSSGAKACRITSARFRYQQRGGFTHLDDPGVEFCTHEPDIISALSTNNVYDLPPGEKVKLLNVLIHQFLTYAATRDLVEDNFEKLKQTRNDLKQLQWGEQRREREVAAERYRRRLEERAKEREKMEQLRLQRLQEREETMKADEMKTNDPSMIELTPVDPPAEQSEETNSAKKQRKTRAVASREPSPVPKIKTWEDMSPEERAELREKEEQEEAQKKEDFLMEETEMMENILQLQHGNAIYPLGKDRLFRRYWMFQSLPGLFIEDSEGHVMDDLLLPVIQDTSSVSFSAELATHKVEQQKPMSEEPNTGSDKENDSFNAQNDNKTLPSVENNTENDSTENTEDIIVISDDENGDNNAVPKVEIDNFLQEFQMTSVAIHQIQNRSKQPWSYISNVQQFDQLINSLNTRGIRESQLKTALLEQRAKISDLISECPVDILHSSETKEEKTETNSKSKATSSVKSLSRNQALKGIPMDNSAQQELEVTLRDMILDIEERIYAGCLGSIKVKDRLAWREAIHEGSYISGTDDPLFNIQQYKEKLNGIEEEGGDKMSETSDDTGITVITELANALHQVQKCLDSKYLKPPLGEDEKAKQIKQKAKEKKKAERDDQEVSDEEEDKPVVKPILEKWEETLLACSSLPQVFLHLTTLEKSIVWSKSALHARCRICRRKGDGEHMLLCDGCDRGHHTYCLKPPVEKIPAGDWFCPTCRPKEKRSPRKDRKKTYESSEEEEENESGSEKEEGDSDNQSDDESVEEEVVDDSSCAVCHKDGMLICCDACPLSYHLKCAKPQLKKVPKGKWLCQDCLGIGQTRKIKLPKIKAKLKKSTTPKSTPSSSRPSSRRESPRDSPVTVKTSRKRGADNESEEDTPKLKKSGKSSSKRTNNADACVQPMICCQEIVHELVKHEDAWPFLKPVNKKIVTDYYEIIKHPMDFSVVHNKINKCKYVEPEDLIRDVRLIFSNCEEYNKKGTQEYKAGTVLCKLFKKKLQDANLDLDIGSQAKISKRS